MVPFAPVFPLSGGTNPQRFLIRSICGAFPRQHHRIIEVLPPRFPGNPMTNYLSLVGAFLLLLASSAGARADRLVLASASYGNNIVAICEADGKVLWSHKTSGPKTGHAGHHDIQFLDNGNILFHENWSKIIEMTLAKKVVWTYDASTMNGNAGKRVEVHAFRRLPGGLTMIAESGVGRIIEVDNAGKIHAELKLKPGGTQHTRMAQAGQWQLPGVRGRTGRGNRV